MKEVIDILSKYKGKGIRISLDASGDNLSVKGDLAQLNDANKKEIRNAREAIILFLKDQKKAIASIEKTTLVNNKKIPLSPNQKRIWVQLKIENDKRLYCIPEINDFHIPNFKIDLFKETLKILTKEHLALAFVFGENMGEPFQQISNVNLGEHLTITELQHLSSSEQINFIDNVIKDRFAQGLNFDQKAPWTIDIFNLGKNQYKFFLNVHHLIADGVSLELIMKEIFTIYDQVEKGEDYQNKHIQYHDYIKWISDKSNHNTSTDFWKNYLKDYSDDFQLFVANKPTSPHYEGDIEIRIDTKLKSEVDDFCKKEKIRLTQFYTFAFGFVLSKNSRAKDLVIGTPSESRNHPQLGSIIGDLVNMLPLRLQFDYADTVINQLKRLKNDFIQVLEHQVYPFEFILEDIHYQREGNKFPLFDTLIAFSNYRQMDGNVNGENIFPSSTNALYNLTCSVLEYSSETLLRFEYNHELYSKEFITSISEQLVNVCRQILLHSNARLSQLSLLDDQQQTEIEKWGSLANGVGNVPDNIIEILAQKFQEYSEKIVLQNARSEVSYKQLWIKSKCIAFDLRKQGVTKGEHLVVQLTADGNLVATMLAIWMIGAVYVPVDVSIPTNRKAEISKDCKAKLIINEAFFEQRFTTELTENFVQLSKEDPAYVLYTSGSTGKPKGVVISHHALTNKLSEEAKLLNLNDESVTLTLTNPSFDVAFLELILPMLNGGRIAIASNPKDIALTISEISAYKVSVLQGTPSYFTHIAAEFTELQAKALNDILKIVCIGGESLNHNLVGKLKKKLPSVQLNNHYGPTEITIDAIVNQDIAAFPVNIIGKPIGNTQVYIVDDFGNLLPKNVVGELLIAGPSIATGYLNQPALSAEKFFTLKKLDKKVYATGDLACWTSEGKIQFFGRKDNQIKHRGYRIEVDEINSKLLEIVNVSNAYTSVIGNSLITWVAGENLKQTALFDLLVKELPLYMIPSAIEIVDFIPMTTNGKVDGNKLPKPQILAQVYVPPKTETEVKLVEIWQEVLAVEKIGVNVNFFQLGGDSLSAIRLQAKYLEIFGKRIDLNDIFKKPTLSENCYLIENAETTFERKIIKAAAQKSYPLSSGQKRIWILSQIEERSISYNMPSQLSLNPDVDISLFEKAFNALIKRHEILRTTFKKTESEAIRQWVLPSGKSDIKIPFFDFSTTKNGIEECNKAILNDSFSVFDLEKGPLFRAIFFKVSNQEIIFYYNMHHIISDGQSIEILEKELYAFYAHYKNNAPLSLEKLSFQYKDYVVNNAEIDEKEKPGEQLSFWKKEFSIHPPEINFPLAKKRPKLSDRQAKILGFHFSENTTIELKEFCQQNETTLFAGLLTTLNVFIKKYTGESDIVVGSPISIRNRSELENQIGFYLNTIAIRNQVDESESFSSFIHRVKDKMATIFSHKSYPFDLLIEELSLELNPSRNQLFDVMFSLQNNFLAKNNPTKVINEVIDYGQGFSKSDIDFAFFEKDNELSLLVKFDTNIYDREIMEQALVHYQALLETMLQAPERPFSDLIYLPESEQIKLSTKLTNSLSDLNLIDFLEGQVNENPDNTAIVFNQQKISFKELDQLSNQFANYLRIEHGVENEDFLSIKMERTTWTLIAIWGVIKVGGAFVPLDPSLSENRVSFINKDADCKVFIDAEFIQEFRQNRAEFSAEKPKLKKAISADALVYAIYTSGSTGTPKGVMVTHGALLNYCQWFGETYDISNRDKTVLLSSLSFDLIYTSLFGGILNGAEVHIMDEYASKDPRVVSKYIKEHNITFVKTTPIFLNGLLTYSQSDLFNSQLGLLLIGGESPNLKDVESIITQSDIRLINHYGPTETTIGVCTFEITKANVNEFISKPTIGTAISNTQVYILDDYGNIVPKGVKGNICVAGHALARGYLNNEQLTAEKFLNASFGRYYNTGDIGYKLSNGNICFVGRKDNQLKIRGYRVELGEIEFLLNSFESITGAAVIVHEKKFEKTIVAFITGKENLKTEDVKNYVKNSLPDYMVPSIIIQIEEFPLTVNRKVDRKKLMNLEIPEFSNEVKRVAPRNTLEEKLVEIWSKVLRKKEISVTNDFFVLGGNSISAIVLTNEYHKAFDVTVDLKDIFLNPSLESQAIIISNKEKSVYIPISRAKPQKNYPLSNAQLRLWTLCQSEETSIAYNMPYSFEIEGDIDQVKFQQAFEVIIQRHEILRTVFIEEHKTTRQEVTPYNNSRFNVDFQDFRGDNNKEDKVKAYIETAAIQLFDLEKGPLIKIGVLQLSDNRHILNLNLHHIISDGWSFNVLIKEFTLVYNAILKNEKHPLSPLNIQYKDYTLWQINQLNGEHLNTLSNYWLTQFSKKSDLPILGLRTDQPRPAIKTYNGSVVTKIIPKTAINALRKITQRKDCSLFMGLMGIVNTLLYRYTGQNDIILGSPIAGRNHLDLEDQIGFYANTLALRTLFKGENTFLELLDEVKEVTLGAYKHQDYPFDMLIAELHASGALNQNQLFDVMVVLQNTATSDLSKTEDLEELSFKWYTDNKQVGSKFDLTFNFSESGEAFLVSIEYNTDLFNTETVNQLGDHFTQLFESIVEKPTATIQSLKYLRTEEENELRYEFNKSSFSLNSEDTIASLFENQASATPHAIAVAYKDKAFTYEALNEASNQFAHYLLNTYAIEPDDLIGLKLEKSLEMMVAMLGILKTGGAYVPIDAGLPEKRSVDFENQINAKVSIDKAEFGKFNTCKNEYSENNLTLKKDGSNLAYVMFTSGSTGIPKGVMIENKSVIRLVKAPNYIHFSKNDALISTGAVSFDATTFEYWGMLLNGGKLVLCSQDDLMDTTRLSQLIKKHEITKMWFTSGWFNQLVQTKISVFSTLETILVGGEKLSPFHINKVRKEYPKLNVINGYGPTENTTFSLTHKIEKEAGEIPIGKPISGTTALILDENLQLTPKGVKGQICFGGAGLARGYLGDQEKSNEKFIPNPLDKKQNIYLTGDYGFWLPDGSIAYLGREDDQVKIRGYRIELGEIESSLLRHENVRDAVVIPRSNKNDEQELIAFVVVENGITLAELKQYLKTVLPSYSLPSQIYLLDNISLTANGKIDRSALLSKIANEAHTLETRAANEEEIRLMQIWSALLGEINLTPNSDFFEVGGHSLKLSMLINEIAEKFGVKIKYRELLLNTTIEQQVILINSKSKVDLEYNSNVYHLVSKAEDQAFFPCTISQDRLWKSCMKEPENPKYNMTISEDISAPFDEIELIKWIKKLAEIHPILKIKFYRQNEILTQAILDKFEPILYGDDITDLNEEKQKEYLAEQFESESKIPFDLQKAPYFRIKYFLTSATSFHLIFVINHIICDGISLEIIKRDFALIIEDAYKERSADLNFIDYAAWEDKILKQPKLLQEVTEFWRKKFKGDIQNVGMPKSFPSKDEYATNSSGYRFVLDLNTQHLLTQYSEKHKISEQLILLTTFYVLLYKKAENGDISVGIPLSNRVHKAFQNTVGFFACSMILRNNVKDSIALNTLLENISNDFNESIQYQFFPLEKYCAVVDKKWEEIISVFYNYASALEAPPIVDFSAYHKKNTKGSKMEFMLYLKQHANTTEIWVSYFSSMFSTHDIEQAMNDFVKILSTQLNNPALLVGDLNLKKKETIQ